MTRRLIVDASAMVDYLVGTKVGIRVEGRLKGSETHVPAHFDAEVLSALGRLHRAGKLTETQVEERVERTSAAPMQRHHLAPLLQGAWLRRHNLRLVDALYVELASVIDATIITTDSGLASATARAELIHSN
jgi:predicted nucleic acid-binding protein